MSEVTRRRFISGAATAAGALVVAPTGAAWAGAAAPAAASATRSLGSYVAFATSMRIPLVTSDPVAWDAAAEPSISAGARARAQQCLRELRDAEAGLALDADDPYSSAKRLNAALRGDAQLRDAVSQGLSAIVDPNGFVDTAALANGGFPESPSSGLPRLQPYPLG